MPTPHEDTLRMLDERDAEIAELQHALQTASSEIAAYKGMKAEMARLRERLEQVLDARRRAKAEEKQKLDEARELAEQWRAEALRQRESSGVVYHKNLPNLPWLEEDDE